MAAPSIQYPKVAAGKGAPTAQQLANIPTHLNVASGIAKGTTAQATGTIDALLAQAEGAAIQASDLIQGAIEDSLTVPSITAAQTVQIALDAIAAILAPLAEDMARSTPKSKKKCKPKSGGGTGVGPGLPPAPSPPPLGCAWLLAEPGTGQPDELICIAPPGALVSGLPAPVVVASPPAQPYQPAPPKQTTIYSVYANCDADQLAGVPSVTGSVDMALQDAGWRPVFPPGSISATSPQDAANQLAALAPKIRAMCGGMALPAQ